MCRKVACVACHRPTWAGCGQHIAATLADTPEDSRCPGWSAVGGTCGFIKQGIANDGNCLFTAVDWLLSGEARSDASSRQRAAVAAHLLADPGTYTEAVLGALPAQYAARVALDGEWGGETELAALAALTQHCLAVVSYAPGAPASLLLYGAQHPTRAYLAYSGQHYDALTRGGAATFAEGAALPALDAAALALGESLRAAAKPRKLIKCCECGAVIDSEAAEQHGAKVQHTEEWCYDFEAVP